MNQNRHKTAHWRITASPRGTLTIPNASHEVKIPVGTLEIQAHLREAENIKKWDEINASVSSHWPSLAELERYQAVLYIEKEGFEPQLEEAEIAEKCDIAIISCKGQSVVAARHFVDEVCHHAGVPLFVVHDFDPAGLSICQRLTSVSDYARENGLVKYEFQNDINVTDFGLRLEDVEEYELESEEFDYKGLPKDTIATDEEKEFFEQGQRVELNAFPAPDFIQWIETKLEDQLDKFVPADDILESAWRRALAVAKINRAIKDTRDQAIKEAEKAKLPKKLRQKLAESQDPWDAALYELAQETVEEEQ